jgi:hypothetical protein
LRLKYGDQSLPTKKSPQREAAHLPEASSAA